MAVINVFLTLIKTSKSKNYIRMKSNIQYTKHNKLILPYVGNRYDVINKLNIDTNLIYGLAGLFTELGSANLI